MLRGVTTTMLWVFRLCWLVNIVLGILFWTGRLPALDPVHSLVGALATILLLWLSAFASAVRGSLGFLGLGVIVFIAMPVVGLSQTGWLVGSAHWIIRAVHVVIAIIAIAMAETAAGRVRRADPATDPLEPETEPDEITPQDPPA